MGGGGGDDEVDLHRGDAAVAVHDHHRVTGAGDVSALGQPADVSLDQLRAHVQRAVLAGDDLVIDVLVEHAHGARHHWGDGGLDIGLFVVEDDAVGNGLAGRVHRHIHAAGAGQPVAGHLAVIRGDHVLPGLYRHVHCLERLALGGHVVHRDGVLRAISDGVGVAVEVDHLVADEAKGVIRQQDLIPAGGALARGLEEVARVAGGDNGIVCRPAGADVDPALVGDGHLAHQRDAIRHSGQGGKAQQHHQGQQGGECFCSGAFHDFSLVSPKICCCIKSSGCSS